MHTQKIAIIFDHIYKRHNVALDHSRLGLKNKFLENKFDKFTCQQIWGRVNQPFILFIHHIWGETVLWGAVFIIQTSDRMQYFTILQYKFHSLNIQDDGSTSGLLAKSLKKELKLPIRPAGSHFWQLPNEWAIIELRFNTIKHLLCLFLI